MAAKSDKTIEKKVWYKRPYILGLLLAIAAIAYFLFRPVVSNDYISWNPGSLHSAHKMLNDNCQACHQGSFEKVKDASCKQCHNVQDHAPQAHLTVSHNCVDCHFEHSGKTALLPADNRLCADCHADLSKVSEGSDYRNVKSLSEHPGFAALDAKDTNTLKLNHALHMKEGLRGSDGKPVQLQCADCHSFSPEAGTVSVKITFEKNCRSCHQLVFDEALPRSVVPHGNEDLIIPHLMREYARLSGQNLNPDFDDIKKIPGKSVKEMKKDPRFIRILEQARQAEELLFTKTSCNLCHSISEHNDVPEKDNLESRYTVEKPEMPHPWFVHANFPHKSHDIVSCESCHAGVLKSEHTSDVLLPDIKNCQQCHIDKTAFKTSTRQTKIETDCVSCHKYHGRQSLSDEQKRMLEPLVQQIIKN